MSMELLDKSGLAYFWTKIKAYVAGLLSSKADDSDVVHKAGDESVTGTKTFVGSKKVAFKQGTANDKLGFTLFNNSNVEQGYLEYNPTNKISGVPLMTLGNYATAAAGLAYVGFRKYSNISGAAGAYNLLTPLISDAKAPFNLTTTYTNFFLPLGVTDGTTTVVTDKSGLLDISPLLVSIDSSDAITAMTGYSKPSSGGAIAMSDSLNAAIGKLEFKVDSVDGSNYVHLTGNETVAGTKTFSNTISGSIDGNAATASAVAWSGVTGKPTTISGYGITDAKIDNGTITLGSNSITPLTSHQDISGKVNKSGDTMTGGLTITNSNTLKLKHIGITRGTAPSAAVYPFFVEFKDNADKTIGGLYYTYDTNKVAKTFLMCYQGTTNANTWNSIGVGYDASGNVFTWAPTPATADNSTKIATTAFVKAQGYLTSHQSLANYSTLANTVKSISISGRTITVTPGSGSAYTLTTQDNNTTYSAATQSANGLMSAADKKKLDGIESGADNIPVGTIIYYAKSTVPTNFLICNGGAVSRTTYATLFGVIGTTFGAGNGSSTFNVPNLIDRFPQGNATPGTVKAAGIPNIISYFNCQGTLEPDKVGNKSSLADNYVFTTALLGHVDGGSSGSAKYQTHIKMDLSKGNTIYGSSSTVQPPALTLVPCIRYA